MWIYIPSPTPWSRCCGILHKKRGLFDYYDGMWILWEKKKESEQTNKQRMSKWWIYGIYLLAIWFDLNWLTLWFFSFLFFSFLFFPFSIWTYLFYYYHTIQHFLSLVRCLSLRVYVLVLFVCCHVSCLVLHFWEETLSSILWYKNKVIISLISK